ncbi:MAG: phage head closure protein [Candidatus Thiodiazotropha lotti]|nr:phage head closure protein [Candidatus Thiodiazotropha lotti]MCW4188323.1 phage head closure protein [Candidatus Thiodiazotropha lotti]
MRHRVTIQSHTTTKSSSGQPVKLWSDVASVRARVTSISGREYYQADQVNSETNKKVMIRFLDGLDTSMRVLHDRKVYEIKAISNQENRRKPTMLMCAYKGELIEADYYASSYWAENHWHPDYWMDN